MECISLFATNMKRIAKPDAYLLSGKQEIYIKMSLV